MLFYYLLLIIITLTQFLLIIFIINFYLPVTCTVADLSNGHFKGSLTPTSPGLGVGYQPHRYICVNNSRTNYGNDLKLLGIIDLHISFRKSKKILDI